MDTPKKKVLVVDDEEHIRTSVRDVLLDEGYAVSLAADATEAMKLIPQEIYDIVIMDIRMPGLDGMHALRQIREYCPQTGIIMISGHGTIDNVVESMKLGAFDFLKKPFALQHLKDTVKNLADRSPLSHLDKGDIDRSNFAGYEMKREIAAGGTATVWEALQRAHNRKVAIKLLHQHLALESNFIQRFQREAEIAASLHHPNIVGVYEYGVHENTHFIAMEYIDGCSLETIISREKKLPWHAAAMLALSVASALEYSHSRNVIHRDVKPGNILLSKEGWAKVTDFGFSRIINSQSARLTMVNRVVGTPLFMAPEMIAGKQASFASDIFSLGIVLYILVCGWPPFTGDTMPSVMQKIMKCDYVKPRKTDRKIPKQLEHIVVSCLQKDPDSRYPSMSAVIDDVKGFIEENSSGMNNDALAEIVRHCMT